MHTVAVEPFFHRVASGKIKLSANTVVVIDELSQVAPRSFLKLLELQAKHGFTVKALGDREQCLSATVLTIIVPCSPTEGRGLDACP